MIQDDNRITLRASRNNTHIFYSTSDFFEVNESYVFEEDSFGFSFKKLGIDESGNCTAIKANRNGNTITLDFVDAPCFKNYQIDQEESTEDEIIINY
tara:strand:+ start:434 stop:724 length:291 start_codon:yes stop_codon:yes gene_type:complete